MIDVTVKTLDSQNHVFTLEDDITVKDFKEHITETVNIPVDLQRLIYCGRVLQDEKRLSEYDVNGKVIHLVQRAPPSVSQRSSTGSNQNQGQSGDFLSSPRIQYRQTQFHGNPMYVGSVSIPADVLEGSDWPIPQLGGSSANAHLTVIRRMLDQANRVIDRMDNANATPSGSSSSGSTTSETEQAPSTVNAASSTTESTTDRPQEQEDTAEQSEPIAGSSATTETSTEPANDAIVPRQLAELLDKLLTTQDRLKPYIRERILINSDNASSSSQSETTTTTVAEQNQRIIDGVTECFHFLSHAQHALSDISIDMQQPPPRTLRCRPMIIQPSTILQAGMPIQVEAHISLHGQSDSSNADSEDGSNNGTSRGSTGSTVPPTSATSREATPATDAATDNNQQQQATSEQQRQSGQNQSDGDFGSLFNFPNNVEVVMEMGPQTPRMWSFSTGGQSQATGTPSSNNNNNNTTTNNNTNGNATSNGSNGGGGGRTSGGNGPDPFPWGAAPSPDIIRNLIQAVAGYMAQGTAGVATSSTASSTQSTQNNSTSSNNSTPTIIRHRTMTVALGGTDSTPSSGQTSGQTRTNTDTHPTTSTQTRTTPRTHVFHQHAQALGVGVAQSLDFDPFLPCNSQHLRRNIQGQSNTTTSTQTGQNSFTTNDNTSTPLQAGAFRFSSGGSGSGSSTPRFTTVAGSVQLMSNNLNQSLTEAINEMARSNNTTRSVSLNSFLMNRGINLAQGVTYGRQRTLIQRVYMLLSKISVNDWFRILNGSSITPFTDEFARSLRHLLRASVPSPVNYARQIPQLFIEELRPYLERTLDDENAIDENMRRIDIRASIEQLIADRGEGIVRSILNEESFSGIVAAIRTLAVDMTRLIRYCLRGAVGYDRVVARFANNMARGTHELFREWILGTVVDWFWRFGRSIPTTSDDSIAAVVKLRYHESAPSPAAPRPAQALSESSLSQSSAQPEPEPMETDAASSDQPDNDPLDDGEDVPTTFPGHEQLLPEWVPIIARDGSRQRRQLQLGLSNDNVTSLSDAYLATMPNKRRKLVEQQKPALLTNSTSNHSVIPSSMERLVRDSVGRAGVEEVEGAASAVAADPTVRRAFGQAIRECLNPRRFQTPDFPDSLRFPNATRLFSESDRSSKQ